jgi:predicted Na+-dependent transporter
MSLQQLKETSLSINEYLDKYLNLIIPISLIFGFLFSKTLYDFVYLIPFLFAYVTFNMALGCSWGQMQTAFRTPLPILAVFILAHGVAPLAAFALGALFFGGSSPYTVGMVLFTVIPIGISSLIWISMTGGAIPLALSMVVLDSALSPLVVPFLIDLFFGAQLQFDYLKLMRDLVFIVVVPTMLGVAANQLSKGQFRTWSLPVTGLTSKVAIVTVIAMNAAAIEPYAARLKSDIAWLVPIIAVLIASCYIMGLMGSKLFKDRALSVTLSYTSGMRNVSLGLVLALGYFEPLVAVPVTLAILIQQPIASVVLWLYKRRGPISERHGRGKPMGKQAN